MLSVELVYDAGCPRVEDARRNVQRALKNLELPATWTEWERSSPFASWAAQFGSPTILVNRDPVLGTGSTNSSLSSPVELEQTAVPSVKTIEVALAQALARSRAGAHSEGAKGEGISPIVIVLVPLSCCLPFVLASLSSLSPLSLGGLLSLDAAFPLVACFLAVVLIGLGLFGRRTRSYGPFAAALVAAAAIMLDTFALSYSPVTYGGVAVLLGASVWGLVSSRVPF